MIETNLPQTGGRYEASARFWGGTGRQLARLGQQRLLYGIWHSTAPAPEEEGFDPMALELGRRPRTREDRR